MSEPLLSMLSTTDYISGEKLCAQLNMTRGAVWKRMEKLRLEGYDIVSGGKKGYILSPKPDSLLPGYIHKALNTRWAGRGAVDYAQEMNSTNTRLKAMAQEGAPKGSLAVCELQTAGRGRMQRSWVAGQGEALTQSLLLKPALTMEQAPLCMLAAAVAVAQAIAAVCPSLSPGIKWPNDVVLGGKKCVGILSEIAADMDGVQYVVMGVGVNVNQLDFPQELAEKATSLLKELRHDDPAAQPLCRRELLCAYLAQMECAMDALESQGLPGIMDDYRRRSVTLGARVRVIGTNSAFEGVAEDIDGTGALLVRDEGDTLRRVLSGDVSVRGLMGYV